MSDPQNLGLNELGQRVQAMASPAGEPRLRSQWEQYQGAPLPVGPPSVSRPAPAYEAYEDLRVAPPPVAPPPPAAATTENFHIPPHPAQPIPPPEAPQASSQATPQAPPPAPPPAPSQAATAAGSAPQDASNTATSGLQRIIQSVRTALPYVQRLLPLLEGNVASAVNALMVPHTVHTPAPPPQPVKVNLDSVERGLTELQTAQRELRTQVQEQTGSIKRVEDQLDRVREATDRNTLEQQELVEDLRSVGNRISNLAAIGLVLLLILLGLNAFFLWRLQHILR